MSRVPLVPYSEEAFARFLRAEPVIWDASDQNHRKKPVTKKAWSKIAAKFIEDHVTVDYLKKEYTKVRNRRAQARSRNKNTGKSGSAGGSQNQLVNPSDQWHFLKKSGTAFPDNRTSSIEFAQPPPGRSREGEYDYEAEDGEGDEYVEEEEEVEEEEYGEEEEEEGEGYIREEAVWNYGDGGDDDEVFSLDNDDDLDDGLPNLTHEEVRQFQAGVVPAASMVVVRDDAAGPSAAVPNCSAAEHAAWERRQEEAQLRAPPAAAGPDPAPLPGEFVLSPRVRRERGMDRRGAGDASNTSGTPVKRPRRSRRPPDRYSPSDSESDAGSTASGRGGRRGGARRALDLLGAGDMPLIPEDDEGGAGAAATGKQVADEGRARDERARQPDPPDERGDGGRGAGDNGPPFLEDVGPDSEERQPRTPTPPVVVGAGGRGHERPPLSPVLPPRGGGVRIRGGRGGGRGGHHQPPPGHHPPLPDAQPPADLQIRGGLAGRPPLGRRMRQGARADHGGRGALRGAQGDGARRGAPVGQEEPPEHLTAAQRLQRAMEERRVAQRNIIRWQHAAHEENQRRRRGRGHNRAGGGGLGVHRDQLEPNDPARLEATAEVALLHRILAEKDMDGFGYFGQCVACQLRAQRPDRSGRGITDIQEVLNRLKQEEEDEQDHL